MAKPGPKPRLRDYINFGPQPGPYLPGGGELTPILYQAVQMERGTFYRQRLGIAKVADYESAKAARDAMVAVCDERRPSDLYECYVETVYVIPEPERWVRVRLRDRDGVLIEKVEGPASEMAKRVGEFLIAQGADPDGEQPTPDQIAGRVEIIPRKTPRRAYIRV